MEEEHKNREPLHERVWKSLEGIRDGVPNLALGKTLTAEPMSEESWLPYKVAQQVCYEHDLYGELEMEDRVVLTNLLRRVKSKEHLKEILEIYNIT